MSVKGKFEEAAGFIEEETGEVVSSEKMKNKGRQLRNAGRIKEGKSPKTTPVGTGN